MIEGITFEPPPLLFITVAVIIGIAIGWGIGFLDSNLRSAKKIEAAETKAARAINEAEQKTAGAAAEAKPVAPFVSDDPGLLRLKSVNGVPALEIDGVPAGEKPISAEKKGRLIELLTLIRPWLEGGQVSKPAEAVKAQSASAPVRPMMSSSIPGSTLPPAKPAEEKNIRSLSIVAQIDTVLQMRLVDTPLAGKGIRLTESSIGGVEVYVGLQKFPSIDQVPDQEIQTAIRAAIAEWDEKYIPGA